MMIRRNSNNRFSSTGLLGSPAGLFAYGIRAFALLSITLLVISCSGKSPKGETITMKGSDTMIILAQRWAEEYMKENPDVRIQVTGGGSGAGISALINGSTDICLASRPMKQGEKLSLMRAYRTPGVQIYAAKDGLSIYTNESNRVRDISIEQLRKVYKGEVTNWKELGGIDSPIVLYGRETSSGTYVFIRDRVLLGADYSPKMLSLSGTAAIVNAVSKDKDAIGYGGAAYAKGIRSLPVKRSNDSKAYLPTEENIKSGIYPISRELLLYTRTMPEGSIKKFIDWIQGPEGKSIAVKVGYFPIK